MQAFQSLMGIDSSGLTDAANYAGQTYGGAVWWAARRARSALRRGRPVPRGAQGNLMNAARQLWQTSRSDPQNRYATRSSNRSGLGEPRRAA